MNRDRIGAYLYSLPERLVRSVSALTGGAVREIGEVVLPARVRRSRLYYSLVDSTLRFLIEQVGQVDGAYPQSAEHLPDDFLIRRAAGNVIEIAGIAAFRASPGWVLAALADVAGAGREVVGEIAAALQEEGLLERGRTFRSVDDLLEGFERTTAQLAESVNTPPLDVAALRRDWDDLRRAAAQIPRAALPPIDRLAGQWRELQQEAAAQGRSVVELSSVIALSAVRTLPASVRWLSQAARAGGRRTGEMVGRGLLDHYRATLAEIRETGYLRYWVREFRPYLVGAVRQFSTGRQTATERFLARRRPDPKRG
jgi:hypothetical protein